MQRVSDSTLPTCETFGGRTGSSVGRIQRSSTWRCGRRRPAAPRGLPAAGRGGRPWLLRVAATGLSLPPSRVGVGRGARDLVLGAGGERGQFWDRGAAGGRGASENTALQRAGFAPGSLPAPGPGPRLAAARERSTSARLGGAEDLLSSRPGSSTMGPPASPGPSGSSTRCLAPAKMTPLVPRFDPSTPGRARPPDASQSSEAADQSRP